MLSRRDSSSHLSSPSIDRSVPLMPTRAVRPETVEAAACMNVRRFIARTVAHARRHCTPNPRGDAVVTPSVREGNVHQHRWTGSHRSCCFFDSENLVGPFERDGQQARALSRWRATRPRSRHLPRFSRPIERTLPIFPAFQRLRVAVTTWLLSRGPRALASLILVTFALRAKAAPAAYPAPVATSSTRLSAFTHPRHQAEPRSLAS